MTLPVGQISFSEVNVEITRPSTQQLDLNDSTVRTLAAVGGSGTAISMSNLQGKTFVTRTAISLVVSNPDTFNYDVYTNRGPTYVPGTSDITVTINPGVRIGSINPLDALQGNPQGGALVVPSQFSPTDTIRIVNNGVILGKGGNGGVGLVLAGPAQDGVTGGDAILTQRPVTIDNLGTIAGGGGGGGAAAPGGSYPATVPRPPRQGGPIVRTVNAAGSGGGGGVGSTLGYGGPAQNVNGPGGNNGNTSQINPASSPIYVIGTGGAAATVPIGTIGAGGNGANLGQAGQNGNPSPSSGSTQIGLGGGAGRYIVGNPMVTWQNTGTRQGGVA